MDYTISLAGTLVLLAVILAFGYFVSKTKYWEGNVNNNDVLEILDEAEYELMDGIGIQGYNRRYSEDEYSLIKAVMNFVKEKFEV